MRVMSRFITARAAQDTMLLLLLLLLLHQTRHHYSLAFNSIRSASQPSNFREYRRESFYRRAIAASLWLLNNKACYIATSSILRSRLLALSWHGFFRHEARIIAQTKGLDALQARPSHLFALFPQFSHSAARRRDACGPGRW